jgi:DNA polymerase III alpha subunit
MSRYYYDLHIHSCLSPCGDEDSTPNNIAGYAMLCGLNIVALCDHNTLKNCPAFFAAAKKYGIIPVAGVELTTSEDIHIILLFEELEKAMEFDAYLDTRRIKIKNKPEIFGEQHILDENDEFVDEEPFLLINATTISSFEVPEIAKRFDAVCYPAHIDRDANGIISILGDFPREDFSCFELHDVTKAEEYIKKFHLEDKKMVVSSDAHTLTDIRDKENWFELDDEPYSSALVRKKLFEVLR